MTKLQQVDKKEWKKFQANLATELGRALIGKRNNRKNVERAKAIVKLFLLEAINKRFLPRAPRFDFECGPDGYIFEWNKEDLHDMGLP